MADLSTKFTDNNLKVLYSNLLRHYQDCMSRGRVPNLNEVYNEMYLATQATVDSYGGSLFHLDHNEKKKVYQAFNAIFYSFPSYNGLPVELRQGFRPARPLIRTVHHVHHYPAYYTSDYHDTLLTWMVLSSLTNNCYSRPPIYMPSGGSGGPIHSHPGTGSSSNKSDDTGQLIAALIIIAIVAAAVALAFIALFYMIHEFANSVERLIYNEGWLKAALMLATSVAFGAASAFFALNVADAPLIALAIAAGFNPIGVVIIGAISLTVIGAGLACFVTSLICDSIEPSVNKDAMDPSDSSRFRLTQSEEQYLIGQFIDPMKVKCALVALRAEMGKILDTDKSIPSFFSRYWGDGSKIQPLLNQVRELRSGKLSSVRVADLTFECRIPEVYHQPPSYHHQEHVDYAAYVQNQVPIGYDAIPSAPPLEVAPPPAYSSLYQ